MVVYLLDRVSDEPISCSGIKTLSFEIDSKGEEFIVLRSRTKVDKYRSRYYSIIHIRD